MIIRRATEADWQALRAIRLQALQDAPLAFASTYEREALFTEDVWRSRTTTSAQFLAIDADTVLGTATGFVDPADAESLRLVAMFVRPEVRGRGCAGLLVQAVVDDARRRRFGRVVLHVVETNIAARAAYERYGFRPTGHTIPLPHAPDLTELELEYLTS